MRTLVVFLLAVLLSSVQSALHTLVPTALPMPALGLMAPMFAALSARWSISRTVVLSFLVGYVFDLLSGTQTGVHALAMPVVGLIGVLLGTRLRVRGPFARTVMTFVLTLLFGLVVLGTSRLGGAPAAGSVGRFFLEAALTAAAAPPIYALFDRVERRFDSSPVRMGQPTRHRLDTGIELRR
jgi:rod shape-determining protein MreD